LGNSHLVGVVVGNDGDQNG